MKNIKLSLILGIIFVIGSLIFIKVDYRIYYEESIRVQKANEHYFFTNKTIKPKGHCDVICPAYRGFPFSMKEITRVLHSDMVRMEIYIFYNFIFYFFICFIF